MIASLAVTDAPLEGPSMLAADARIREMLPESDRVWLEDGSGSV